MNWQTLIIVMLYLGSAPLFGGDIATLAVTVTGVTPNRGEVVASLFNERKNWLKKPMREERGRVTLSDSVDIIFADLPIGEYAISVYYDLDDDGEMDTGMFGIPSEPVGFSNNARGRFGPAKWKKAAFKLENDLSITIHVVNAID